MESLLDPKLRLGSHIRKLCFPFPLACLIRPSVSHAPAAREAELRTRRSQAELGIEFVHELCAQKKPVEKLTRRHARARVENSPPRMAMRQLLDGLRYFARGLKCRGMVLPFRLPPCSPPADAVDLFIPLFARNSKFVNRIPSGFLFLETNSRLANVPNSHVLEGLQERRKLFWRFRPDGLSCFRDPQFPADFAYISQISRAREPHLFKPGTTRNFILPTKDRVES
jgi:hypothetical protein